MTTLCLTVDVEDFYDGMAVLGCEVPRPSGAGSGLEALMARLEGEPKARLTFFVVGDYAPQVREPLRELARLGHEIASHGPDHGRLPSHDLPGWLRRGREVVEDLVQAPVEGFRSPRFDLPLQGLAAFRGALADAGYRYVSDASRLGPASPVGELPVFERHGLRVGGGSYQRLLPASLLGQTVAGGPGPAVCYYHSYDFGGALPPLRSVRSVALAKQLLGRGRVARSFSSLLARFGSERCIDVVG